MIDLSGLISIQFVKKSRFAGSYQGMRYLLRKDDKVIEEANGEAPAKIQTVLTAVIWPEPYNWEMTAEEKKHSAEFVFSQDGILEAVVWLNQEYEAGHY